MYRLTSIIFTSCHFEKKYKYTKAILYYIAIKQINIAILAIFSFILKKLDFNQRVAMKYFCHTKYMKIK